MDPKLPSTDGAAKANGAQAPVPAREPAAELAWLRSELSQLRGELDGARAKARAAEESSDRQLAELLDENQRLLASNRQKDELLDVLAHELRDPLSPIATLLQLLRLRGETALKEERAVLERHTAHLVLLVDDLLDAARITGGRMALKKERVELAETVSRALELTRPMLDRLRHKLVVDIAKKGLAIDADPRRIVQVITSLLTNAAKHTESGGGVTLSGAREDGKVVLRARFELFVQGPHSAARSPAAMGLGFTVVERLIGLHGGSFSMETLPIGQGAEFRIALPPATRPLSLVPVPEGERFHSAPEGENLVTLSRATGARKWPAGAPRAAERGDASADADALDNPLEDPAADNDSSETSSDDFESGAKSAAPRVRVLIVDDNEDSADMLSYLLEELGFATAVAHDGASALEMAREEKPDVALLDLRLPVMDGYQIAARMREEKALAGVKLIAVTGFGNESERQRTKAAGFDAHLVKPIEAKRLVDKLDELTGNRPPQT